MGKNINNYTLIDENFIIDDIKRGLREIDDDLNVEICMSDISGVYLH